VKCTQCGAAFRDADIDVRGRTATCRFCGAVTELPPESVPEQPLPAAQPAVASVRPKVPRPNSIALDQTSSGIRMTYRWFTPMLIFLACFCVAWDGFLVVWYSIGIGGAFIGAPRFVSLLFMLFPIGHVAVGVALTYYTLAGFLNRTLVDISQDELRVWHGPVPWKGNKLIPVAELDTIFSTIKLGGSQKTQGLFCVSALLKDGRTETLLSGLPSAQEPRYIERTIEEFLGLQHHAVAGELPG